MNRAYVVLGLAVVAAGGATVWAHYAQVRQKRRMHAGVLRDIEKEKAAFEQQQKLQQMVAVSADSGRECVGDVCSYGGTRFRDPKTGQVYEPTPNSTS